MGKISDRLAHAWNTLIDGADTRPNNYYDIGAGYGTRPDRARMSMGNERSIISSVYTKLGMDVAGASIRHVRVDDNGSFLEDMDSGLNNCLTVEANIDQAARAFRQDIAMTLFDKGVVAIVPVDTSLNPDMTGGYDIKTMRVAEVKEWYPRHVKVCVYNDQTGRKQDITLSKTIVTIIENPLYSVMNEPNSTLQRLIRKLNLLDSIDEQSGSGKLDLIIQLPYVIKSEARRQQAEQRRKDIEIQMSGSKYGIAYADGTEKITQLNRPAENNLLKQIEYLTGMLYGQLGLTEDVFSGKADETTMLNYYNRTIDPILDAITEGMKRTFLTSTARTQKQSIEYFRNPFKSVPMSSLAEMADKLTRNEILTSNEFRGIIGFRPSKDPKADMLVNKNVPQAMGTVPGDPAAQQVDPAVQDSAMNDAFAALNQSIDQITAGAGLN